MYSAITPFSQEPRLPQEMPLGQPNPNYRQSQGYITLSPARRNKERSRAEKNMDRFEIEHEKSVS
jgi:hypothetical protein